EIEQKINNSLTLGGMKRIYTKHFPKAKQEFRDGRLAGVEFQSPVRLELNAGSIGDFSGIAANMPHLYMILNASALLTKQNGAIGRNIDVNVEVRDLKDMPKRKQGKKEEQSFLTVRSLDMNWEVPVFSGDQFLDKNNATLILDAISALGIFPKA